jgi:hypothetical protein
MLITYPPLDVRDTLSLGISYYYVSSVGTKMNGACTYKTLDGNLIDTKVVARYAFKKKKKVMSLTLDIVYVRTKDHSGGISNVYK